MAIPLVATLEALKAIANRLGYKVEISNDGIIKASNGIDPFVTGNLEKVGRFFVRIAGN